MSAPTIGRGLRRFSAGVIGLHAAAAAGVLAYALVFSQVSGGGIRNHLLYFALPGAAAAVLAAALIWLPAVWRVNLALLLLSGTVSLYAGEGLVTFLRAHAAVPPAVLLRNQGQQPVDLLKALRAQGIDAYPAWVPALALDAQPGGDLTSPLKLDGAPVLPLSGAARSRIVGCKETAEIMTYDSDRYGFNNPDAAWDLPSIDALLLGDSFAHGDCQPRESTLAGRLRSDGNTTITLGMRGNGPLITLAALSEYLPRLKPRVVVWTYYESNDLIYDLRRERNAPLLARYLDEAQPQHLLERASALDSQVKAYLHEQIDGTTTVVDAPEHWWDADHLGTFLRLASLRRTLGIGYFTDPPVLVGEDDYGLFMRILAVARARSEASGAKFLVVYLPGPERYYGQAGPIDTVGKEVLRRLRDGGYAVVDGLSVFAGTADPRTLFVLPNSHYNRDGYAKIADAVHATIAKLLPAPQ